MLLIFLDLIVIDQDFKEVTKNLNPLLDLSLYHVEHSLCEILVQLESLRIEVAIDSTFKVEVRLIEVLVLKAELRDLEESVSCVDLSACLVIFDNLLKVKDGLSLKLLKALLGDLLLCSKALGGSLLQIPFGKYFAYVKVGLD